MKRTVFDERQSLLAKNGFVSYKKYLDSKLWERIRAYVLSRDGYRCRLCGEKGKLVAHHMTYDTNSLFSDPRKKGGKKNLKHVVTLCFSCHDRVHTDGEGEFKHIGRELEAYLHNPPQKGKGKAPGRGKKKKKGKSQNTLGALEAQSKSAAWARKSKAGTPLQKAILFALATYVPNGRYEAEVRQSQLAEDVASTKAAVNRGCKELEDAGLISSREIPGAHGGKAYRLAVEA